MAQPLLLSGIGHAGLPLYTNEQLAVSASIKAGLEPEKELVWRRQYTSFIIDCGKELQVPIWAIYAAVFLCHHYFAKRSMTKNDRYLVATACLYLACKVMESPKYLRDVIKTAEMKKWANWQREHPAEPRKWDDQAHLEAMRDQVLVAERAVLYTISFQMRIKVPYNDILAWQTHVPKEYRNDIINIAWSLTNDSLWTTMCLVYAPEKIAATCLFLAHEIHGLPLPGVDPAAPPTPRAEEQPDPNSDRRFFCQTFNIMDQELEEISDELLDVYTTVLVKDTQDHIAVPTQPSSPDADNTHLQLQDNRVRLVLQLEQQQSRPQQRTVRMTPATPGNEELQQLQQQRQQQQQPNGVQQHAGGS